MKKLLAITLISAIILSGCNSKPEKKAESVEPVEAKKEISIENIVSEITLDIGITNPVPIDDAILQQYIAFTFAEQEDIISVTDLDEYYGLMCTTNAASDFIIGIKASDEYQPQIVELLNNIRDFKAMSFENFIDEEYQKAKAANVVTTGNYTFIAILGDPGDNPDENAKMLEEKILSYFE